MNIVEQLEDRLVHVKEMQEQAEKVIALSKNPLFREIILEGFCRDEVARLAHVAGDPNVSTQAERDLALQTAMAGGHLKRFLNIMIQQANTALNDVPHIEEALSQARAQEEATNNADFTTLGGEPVYDQDSGE